MRSYQERTSICRTNRAQLSQKSHKIGLNAHHTHVIKHVTCNLIYWQPATSQFRCVHVIIVIDANRSR